MLLVDDVYELTMQVVVDYRIGVGLIRGIAIDYSIDCSLLRCMQTLEIKVPDRKIKQVKEFLKELGVTVKLKKQKNVPNADTIAAIDELKAGKGRKFKSIAELFNSI